jgi:hypothetical protein
MSRPRKRLELSPLSLSPLGLFDAPREFRLDGIRIEVVVVDCGITDRLTGIDGGGESKGLQPMGSIAHREELRVVVVGPSEPIERVILNDADGVRRVGAHSLRGLTRRASPFPFGQNAIQPFAIAAEVLRWRELHARIVLPPAECHVADVVPPANTFRRVVEVSAFAGFVHWKTSHHVRT